MKKIKKIIATALVALSLGGVTAGLALADNVQASAEGSTAIVMDNGAAVRVDGENNGIRFSAKVAKSTVDGWESSYKSVSLGMLIMPKDYETTYGPLSQENVFGSNAIYCWGSAVADKTQIVNLGTLSDYLTTEGDNYVVKGSLVGIKEKNLDREFVGRAYAKLTSEDGTVSYQMADYAGSDAEDSANNTRSIVDVCDSAYKDHVDNGTCPDGVTYDEYKSFLKSTVSTAIDYRLSLLEGEINADNVEQYDEEWEKAYALLKGLTSTTYNATVQAADVEKINEVAYATYDVQVSEAPYLTTSNDQTISFGGGSWTTGMNLQGLIDGKTTLDGQSTNGMYAAKLDASTAYTLGWATDGLGTNFGATMTTRLYMDSAADYAVYLPKINYAENYKAELTFTMGSGANVTNLTFTQGATSTVKGWGGVTASFVYADGKLSCTLTKGANTESIEITDSEILNGTKSVVLFVTTSGVDDLNFSNMALNAEKREIKTTKLDPSTISFKQGASAGGLSAESFDTTNGFTWFTTGLDACGSGATMTTRLYVHAAGNYAVYLPKINYAENYKAELTFTMGSGAIITNLTFTQGATSTVKGWGGVTASFVYADGKLSCTLTKGANTESIEITDSEILNGTKSVVLFVTTSGAGDLNFTDMTLNRTVMFDSLDISSYADTTAWRDDVDYQDFERAASLTSVPVNGDFYGVLLDGNTATAPLALDHKNYLQETYKIRFQLQTGNLAIFLPKIDFVRNSDVVISAFRANDVSVQSLSLSSDVEPITIGWGAFTISFQYNGEKLLATLAQGTTTQQVTITDYEIICGAKRAILYVTSTDGAGDIQFGSILSNRQQTWEEKTFDKAFLTAPGEASAEPIEKEKVTLQDREAITVNGNYSMDLSEITEAIERVKVNGKDWTVADKTATLATTEENAGTYEAVVETETKRYVFNVTIVYTITLDSTNAGTLVDFIGILNAAPNGKFVLAEDLDFGGAISSQVVKSFEGTLDGNGYSIKNFEIKYGLNTAADDNISVLFENNSGTIKNLGVDYIFGTGNSSNCGLIETNTGTVDNVYVKVQVNATPNNTFGAIVGMNKGVINNSVVVMTIKEGLATDKLAAIAGYNNGADAKMTNVYGIVANTSIPYTKYPWGTATNVKLYADMAAMMAEVTALPAENGWNTTIWSVENGIVCFNGTPIVDAIILNQDNAGTPATFAALLKATPAGRFVLTEDLDWGNANTSAIPAFSGELDGQGHSIKNFKLALGNDGTNYNYCLFGANSGTIKNIGFTYSFPNSTSGNNKNGLIYTNTGTIENVYVDCTLIESITGQYHQIAPLVNTNINTGIVKNSIVKMTIAEGVTYTADTVAGAIYSNKDAGTVDNVYLVSNDETLAVSQNQGATQTNEATYSSLAEIAALSGDGWNSDVWSMNEHGVVCFNDVALAEAVATEKTLPAQTVSINSDGKYVIDLSAITLTQEGVTLNGVDASDYKGDDGKRLEIPANMMKGTNTIVVKAFHTYTLTVTCEDMITVLVVHADYSDFTTPTANGNTEHETVKKRVLYDFVGLYKEITGIDLEIKLVYSAASDFGAVDYSKNNLIVGERLAKSVFGDSYADGLTTDTGYRVKTDGNNVFVYGKNGYGMANGLYALLKQVYGVEFYSGEVYTKAEDIAEGAGFKIGAIQETTFNPSVDYNWAIDGDLYTYYTEAGTDANGNSYKAGDVASVNYKALLRLGYVNSWPLQNQGYHDCTNLLDTDLLAGQTTASDWIKSLKSDVGLSFNNLNWAATSTNSDGKTLAQVIASVLAGKINAAKAQQTIFFLGVPDHVPADQTAYGTTDQYLAFVNKVAAELESLITRSEEIDLVMMAYAGALTAPTGSTKFYNGTKVDVKVMYAPIRMLQNYDADDNTYTNPDGKTVKWYMDNYAKWKALGDEDDVFVWNYSATFSNFFMPTDTIAHMQSQYQAFVGDGISHMMNQGAQNSTVQTNFAALKSYLKGQLAKNVNADMDTLIKNFCNAYYGAAGETMYDLLKMEEDHLNGIQAIMSQQTIYFNGNKFASTTDISSYYTLMPTKGSSSYSASTRTEMLRDVYWGGSTNIFTSWYAKIAEALAKDGLTDAQIERIQVEAIAIRYMSLKVHGEAVVSGDTMAKVASDAADYGITMYSEGGAIANLS